MKKLDYLSIINAIAIIAVLIGHLDITGIDNDPQTPIANSISIFGSFQMPLFVFVSGYLFTMTSGYKKSYKSLIVSKVKRLLVPFLFLSFFTFAFKFCLPSNILEHNVGLNSAYLFRLFFIPFRGPVPHLWFVVSLFTMFLLTPLLKWTLKSITIIAITLILLMCIQIASQIGFMYLNTEIFAIDKTTSFIIWFYLGMIAQIHGYSSKLDSYLLLAVSGALYSVLLYYVHIPLIGSIITNLIGIVFIYSLSLNIVKFAPNLFNKWRNYSYQIYLLHMFPIMLWKFIYKTHLIKNDDIWFSLIWILSLVSAIMIPTIIAKYSENMPQKVRILIGL